MLKSIGLSLVLAGATLTVAAQPAAAREYPWCAHYSETTVGATNCGFDTQRQCLDTIHGLGGICVENGRYVGPAPRDVTPRRDQRGRSTMAPYR